MNNNYTKTTSQSWFSRIKSAFSGILFGLALFIGAFVLLFWNEGRAVQTHKTLQEGAGLVASVDSQRADPTYEGKLVHISGRAATEENLSDPMFNITVKAIRLEREAEMLQWREHSKSETRKKLGGGTETVTTYSYKPEWSNSLISSGGFFHAEGHENPASFPLESQSRQAERVSVGAFNLSPGLISRINNTQAFPLKKSNKPSKKMAGKARIMNNMIYFGSKSHEKIGDVRVLFRVVYPSDVSIIAKQSGNGFLPFKAKAGGTIQMLKLGKIPANSMFEDAISQNKILTWVLRFVGLIIMYLGLKMFFRIFSVLGDVVPLFGNIIGAGTSLIAFLVSLCLSLITISIAWLFYRPLIGGTLLAIAIGVAIFTQTRLKKVSGARTLQTE